MQLRLLVTVITLSAVWALKPAPVQPKIPEVSVAKPRITDDKTLLLPETVVPSSYDLTIKTTIDKFGEPNADFSFTGNVIITVNVKTDVSEIVLHSHKDITIVTAKLTQITSDGTTTDLKTAYADETQKLTLQVDESGSKITAGDYSLQIDYKGINNDEMRGFYRSSYVNDKNVTKWVLTTQFESTDARRAFPCFDEPKYKATFVIKVYVPKSIVDLGYGVLSNMPQDGEATDVDDQKVFKFVSSAKVISTYLVAFIVSDFKSTELAHFEENKPFATWGREGPVTTGEGSISQISGPAVLDIMNDKTKVTFGYPKVDQVGIPDFNAGAMENWGLITYRERLIFYNEENHPYSQKQSVVTTTAHELAHQWFGDLVTLHWWSDIWLNEGFATFFEYHATDKIDVIGLNTTSWNMVGQMVVDELQASAFDTDSQLSSRPLTSETYVPEIIDSNFDNIAYAKGGSVIRMWMHILGAEKFYAALKSYLDANAEKVGNPELLLGAFDAQVPDNLKDKIKPSVDFAGWHKQAGYPVLNVTRNGNETTITQQRFLVSGKPVGTAPLWTVPITFTTNKIGDFENTTPQFVLKPDQDKLTITHDEDVKWAVFNTQQTGFYRVNYDEASWEALSEALITNRTGIHELNRAQLLDDALWLARTTNDYAISYKIALNMSKFLIDEKELIPWKAALNGFNFLYGKLANNATLEPLMKTFILKRIINVYNNLSLIPNDTDSHTSRLLRPLVASWACKLENPQCVSAAKKLFDARGGEKIPPDVLSTVMCTGVRQNGDEDTWKLVWTSYEQATDNSQQTLYLSALGCVKNVTLLNGYLNKTLTPDSGIRKQDTGAVFSSVYNGNPSNIPVALAFLKNNLEAIATSYDGLNPLVKLITGFAGKLSTADDLKAIQEIRDAIKASTNSKVSSALEGANSAVAIVESNKEWMDKKQEDIGSWLLSDDNDTDGDSAVTSSITALLLLLPALLAYINMQ